MILGLTVDYTLHVSDLFTAAGFLIAAIAGFYAMKYQVRWIVAMLKRHDKKLEEHGELIEAHEQQINVWRGAGVGGHDIPINLRGRVREQK